MRTYMTRSKEDAEKALADMQASVGQVVGRYGRIVERLVGAELREVEFTGRPLFQVIPAISTHDPLFDA